MPRMVLMRFSSLIEIAFRFFKLAHSLKSPLHPLKYHHSRRFSTMNMMFCDHDHGEEEIHPPHWLEALQKALAVPENQDKIGALG